MQLGSSVRHFAPVDPKGIKITTRPAALKAAKQNVSLAAKIKTKIQNTSSFFKVSLKNNNKALALALVAQKEKSRALEAETVHLRKEGQALRFDLALHRHKHNQLVKLLKDLQANALKSLVTAVDLLSADDDSVGEPEEIDEKSPPDPEDAHMELGSKVSRIPLLSKTVGKSARRSPNKQTQEPSGSPKHQPVDPSEEIRTQPSIASLPRVKAAPGNRCNEDTETAKSVPPLQEKSLPPSSGLRLAVDKWSRIFSDSPLEPETIPASLAVNPRPVAQPSPEPAPAVPSGSPQGASPQPERTTLCEAEMEITLGNATAEIVTVETKPKKSRKEGMAKLRKKESKRAEETHPPDEEERKKNKKKDVSVRGDATEGTDAPPTQGRGMAQMSAPSLALVSAKEEKGANSADGEPDWFAGRRNLHVTSRDGRNRRQARDAPKSTAGAFPAGQDLRKTYVISLDRDHANADSVASPEDDYFSDAETRRSGIAEKGIPWDSDPQEDGGSAGKSGKTCVIATAPSSSAVNRKTYVISDGREQGRASAKSRRTKVQSGGAENEPAAEGPGAGDAGHAARQTEHETSLLKSGPARDPLSRLIFEGNPDALDGPVIEENPPWENPDPTSALPPEPKPKKRGKESGAIEGKKKKRKQRDDACSQVKKRKRNGGREQEDHPADVPGSWGYGETLTPPSVNPAGPGTSCRKKVSRKTNIISVNACARSSLADSVLGAQPLQFPAEVEIGGDIKAVTVSHMPVDSTREGDQGNDAYSYATEARSCEVKRDAFWEPRLHVSQVETDAHVHQTGPVVSRNVSGISSCHSRVPSARVHRSTGPPSMSHFVWEKEAHAGGGPEETREGLKKLILAERPPWEPLDDSCTSFSGWDVPVLGPASSPVCKPTPGGVSVYEEQCDRAPESSPGGRALKSLTNTAVTADAELGRVRRRGKTAVSYKEPSINCKMRRGDKFSDTKFLSSPIFKEKRKKKTHVQKPKVLTELCFNHMD